MKNYLVISYLADSDQIVFDTVLAEDREAAGSEVRRVRGDDIGAAEVHETVEFATTVAAWAAETPAEIWESWNLTVESYGVTDRDLSPLRVRLFSGWFLRFRGPLQLSLWSGTTAAAGGDRVKGGIMKSS